MGSFMGRCKDPEDRARKVVERVPLEGIFANTAARLLLRDLIEHEIAEHARLAVLRARKNRRKRS